MGNPIINPQPNYSGVTIQISNPAVNLGASGMTVPPEFANCNASCCCNGVPTVRVDSADNINENTKQNSSKNSVPSNDYPIQTYPAQYYLNNYNYQTNGKDSQISTGNGYESNPIKNSKQYNSDVNPPLSDNELGDTSGGSNIVNKYAFAEKANEEQDFTKSTAIIGDLSAREAAEAEAKKNTKEKRVVALTDEYIRSLENYLNNPNNEIRLMASKEILTRLDEDKDRYNDAALNALLNKMLQNPSKLVRIAALSAFSSQLASGNDYTVTLLKNIQNNPSADKEDVLQAADILLKMSGGTEIKHIPVPEAKDNNKPENKR